MDKQLIPGLPRHGDLQRKRGGPVPEKQIFREKAMGRITSPDQLTDYLHVTNTSVWVILVTVIVLLAGVYAWASIGVLESTAEVSINVQNGKARVFATGGKPVSIAEGMTVREGGREYAVETVEQAENGWQAGVFHTDRADGFYNGVIITDSIRPIDFLLESR